MKFSLTISLVFILVTLLGASMHEIIRACTSKILGNTYSRFYLGELHFGNAIMDSMKPQLSKKDGNLKKIGKPYLGENKMNAYMKWWVRNQALIELSSKLFIFSVCFAGLIILFIRRNKRKLKFETIDWVAVIFSCFIMEQVFLSSFFIFHGATFCEYGMFTEYFKLPFWGTEWTLAIFGILIFSFLIFQIIPRSKRIPFLISGLVGGLSGIALWFFFVGDLLFG